MSKPVFAVELIYGSVELVEDIKFEAGKLWMGGHAIYRDRNGTITKITGPEYYCHMSF